MTPDEVNFLASLEAGTPDLELARNLFTSQQVISPQLCTKYDLPPGATFAQAATLLRHRDATFRLTGGVVG